MKSLTWYQSRAIVEGLSQRIIFNQRVALSLQRFRDASMATWRATAKLIDDKQDGIERSLELTRVDLDFVDTFLNERCWETLAITSPAYALGYFTGGMCRYRFARLRHTLTGLRMSEVRAWRRLNNLAYKLVEFFACALENSLGRINSKVSAMRQVFRVDCPHVRRSLLFIQLFTAADDIEEITGDALELYERKAQVIGANRAKTYLRRKAIGAFFSWLRRMVALIGFIKEIRSVLP
ncbi:MAG: hypothetical protein ACRYGF_07530 [Janthinobacterium lividum]